MSQETLKCSTCQQHLSLDKFRPSKAKNCLKRGYTWQCKECAYKSCRAALVKKRGYETPALKHLAPEGVEILSTDLAWIAGFTDAEGSLHLGSNKEIPLPRVTHSNTVVDGLKFIQSKLGGYLSTRERENRPNSRPEHTLQFSNQINVPNFCKQVSPFMTLKKPQAELFLKFFEIDPGKRHSKDRTKFGFEIKELIEEMNRKSAMRTDFEATVKVTDLDDIGDTEYAYLAGYVEGDGTLSIEGRNANVNWYPHISVFGTKPVSMTYLHDIFGGSLGFYSRPSHPNWSDRGFLEIKDHISVEKILYRMTRFLKFKFMEAYLCLCSLQHNSKEREAFSSAIQSIRGMTHDEAQEVLKKDKMDFESLLSTYGIPYEIDEDIEVANEWRAKKDWIETEEARIERGDLYPEEQQENDQLLLDDPSIPEADKPAIRERMAERQKLIDEDKKESA